MAKKKKAVDDTYVSPDDTTIPPLKKVNPKNEVDNHTNDDMVVASNSPAGTQEQKMSDTITIQGLEFAVPVPYTEGHVLTAGEASALNQVFHENLRNNFAAKIKKLKNANGEAIDHDALQADLNSYAETYQFCVRTSGGPRIVADPVKHAAINLAKGAIKAALAKAGTSLKEAGGAEWLNKKAAELVATRPVFMEQAKARVEELQSLAAETLAA